MPNRRYYLCPACKKVLRAENQGAATYVHCGENPMYFIADATAAAFLREQKRRRAK